MPQGIKKPNSSQPTPQRSGSVAPANQFTQNSIPSITPPTSNPQQANKTEMKIPKLKPFFWLAIASVLGPIIADWLSLDWQPWLAVFLFGSLLAILEFRRRSGLLPKARLPLGLALAAFGISAMLYVISLPIFGPQFCAFYNEKGDVDLQVLVVKPPELREGSQNLVVKVLQLHPIYLEPEGFDPHKISGKVLIQTAPGETYHYGDRLQLRAELQTPSEGAGFDYRAYLRHQGIYSSIQYASLKKIASGEGNPLLQLIYNLRLQASKSLEGIFPAQESALFQGILLGNAHALSEELKLAYALTGTAHIYAISGFNMVVLADLVTRFLTRKQKNWKAGLAVITVLSFYTVMVGATASVIRAAIMGSHALVGRLIGRKGNLLNTLGFTVFLMLLFKPHLPWDIGFQLTVMATLGLSIFSGPLTSRLEEFLSKKTNPQVSIVWSAIIGEYLIVTLVAQASVLPLIAFHFHQVSPLFLVANPLVLPVQPLVMVFGLLAMLGGMVSLSLGRALAWIAWPFAAFTNTSVRFLAELWPNTFRMPRFDFVWVFLAYTLLFFLFLNGQKQAKPWLNAKVLLLATGVSALILWVNAAGLPDGRLKLRVLPAQDRANLLITTASGRHLFLGGSGSANGLSASLSQALPVTHQELDWLIIPRCGRSDVSALFNLPDQVKVRQVLWLCDWERIQTTKTLFSSFSEQGLNQRRALPEDALLLAPELLLSFNLDEDNLESVHVDGVNFTMPFTEKTPSSEAAILLTPDQLILNNTACSGICPSVPKNIASYHLADYTWLEIQSDGNSIFLSGSR